MSHPKPSNSPLPTSVSPSTTLYFAYGSNLSPTQMHSRCPNSPLVGVARLRRARWFINGRGYASVVPLDSDSKLPVSVAENVVQTAPQTHVVPPTEDVSAAAESNADEDDDVWGLLYALAPADEVVLDGCEGVPKMYGKEWHLVHYWPLVHGEGGSAETHAVDADVLTVADPFGPAKTREGTAPFNLPSGSADVRDGVATAVKALLYIDRHRIERGTIAEEYVLRMRRGMLEAGQRGVPKEWMDRVIAAGMGV